MCFNFSVAEVKTEMKSFHKRFNAIQNLTMKCLEKCKIVVQTVVSLLMFVFEVDDHKEFLEEKQDSLLKCTGHLQLFGTLSLHHWNYLSYNLLDKLIEELSQKYCDGSFQKISEKMDKYKKDLQEFRQRTRLRHFYLAKPILQEETPPGFTNMVVKHKWPNTITLEDVELFRQRYAQKYSLQECALMLHSILEGSFIITWFVPVTLVAIVLRESKPLEIYKDYFITSLEIDGVCVYDFDSDVVGEGCSGEGGGMIPAGAASRTVIGRDTINSVNRLVGVIALGALIPTALQRRLVKKQNILAHSYTLVHYKSEFVSC